MYYHALLNDILQCLPLLKLLVINWLQSAGRDGSQWINLPSTSQLTLCGYSDLLGVELGLKVGIYETHLFIPRVQSLYTNNLMRTLGKNILLFFFAKVIMGITFQFPAQEVCDCHVDVIWNCVTNQALITQEWFASKLLDAVMNVVLVTLKP